MKKYLVWILAMILLVSCTACAAEVTMEEEQVSAPAEEFVFSEEEGYAYAPVPLGVTFEEATELMNCTFVSKAESVGGVHSEENDYYWTLELDAVELLGKKARAEVGFTEGKLFDLCFYIRFLEAEDGEVMYSETLSAFKEDFGAPMEEVEREDYKSALWRHTDNTQILFSIKYQEGHALVQVGVTDITSLGLE